MSMSPKDLDDDFDLDALMARVGEAAGGTSESAAPAQTSAELAGRDLALVRASPDRHQEITRFPVLEGKTWNVPALSGGYLLVRNLAEMAAFDLRVGK